jgi:hypothetical protein
LDFVEYAVKFHLWEMTVHHAEKSSSPDGLSAKVGNSLPKEFYCIDSAIYNERRCNLGTAGLGEEALGGGLQVVKNFRWRSGIGHGTL